MEEEFQGGVCGGSWWNSSRNLFTSSPCSAAVNGWLNPSLIVDMKTANSVSDDSTGSASDGGSSVVLQEAQQPQLTPNGTMLDSNLEIMTNDWSHDFLHDNARSQANYSHILQLQALNASRENIADFSADSYTNSFRQQVYQSFVLDQQPPNSFSNSPPTSFPFNTVSCGFTSSLPQTLFDADSQPQQALPDPYFRMNSSGVVAPMMKPSIQKPNNFQFINNTAYWNATAPPCSGDARASFLPSSTPQLLTSALTKPKLNQQSFSSKHLCEKAKERDSMEKKAGNEPSFKRPRIETPSPLPTFKVRKEKLGDRVTALQQLVSPFGKTDTASVLHEAIEYIKLLHDQVAVLSTPYLKNGPHPLQRQQASNKLKDQEEPSKDLRSRGLCLVPISSTFPVATETTADFWTPTFGASFRSYLADIHIERERRCRKPGGHIVVSASIHEKLDKGKERKSDSAKKERRQPIWAMRIIMQVFIEEQEQVLNLALG